MKLARAWGTKELFAKFWVYKQEGRARPFFSGWFGWASGGWLKPVIRVVQLLKGHLENLPTYLKHHITNAVTGGLNWKIYSLNAAARGFRSFHNYRIQIVLFAGQIQLFPL